jgi:hypothetical protein
MEGMTEAYKAVWQMSSNPSANGTAGSNPGPLYIDPRSRTRSGTRSGTRSRSKNQIGSSVAGLGVFGVVGIKIALSLGVFGAKQYNAPLADASNPLGLQAGQCVSPTTFSEGEAQRLDRKVKECKPGMMRVVKVQSVPSILASGDLAPLCLDDNYCESPAQPPPPDVCMPGQQEWRYSSGLNNPQVAYCLIEQI